MQTALRGAPGPELQPNTHLSVVFELRSFMRMPLIARFNYIEMTYNGDANTQLGFEMLEALRVGANYTWNLSAQRSLGNNMQLNLSYDGRKSPGSPTIHTGGVQVRAYF